MNDPSEGDLSAYQQFLKKEGKYRLERAEKLRTRIKEIRNYIKIIFDKQNQLMNNVNENYEAKLLGMKGIVDDSLQCLYHLKMIFLSSECFNEGCVEELEGIEKDLKGVTAVCDSMYDITGKNKPELLQGLHHIIIKDLAKALKISHGHDNPKNFEYLQ
jgi:hypothetical protein